MYGHQKNNIDTSSNVLESNIEEDVLSLLEKFYSNKKVKTISIDNVQMLLEKFCKDSEILELHFDGFDIVFEGMLLFTLKDTCAIKNNACCVVRDLIKVLRSEKKDISFKNVCDRIRFNWLWGAMCSLFSK